MAWTTVRFVATLVLLGYLCYCRCRYLAFVSSRDGVLQSTLSSSPQSSPETTGENSTSSSTTSHHLLAAQSSSSFSASRQCGLYFAPSTIPGAGFGLFAGRHFEKGKLVTHGDLVVPLVDLTWHYGDERFADDLWEEYRWSAAT